MLTKYGSYGRMIMLLGYVSLNNPLLCILYIIPFVMYFVHSSFFFCVRSLNRLVGDNQKHTRFLNGSNPSSGVTFTMVGGAFAGVLNERIVVVIY